MLYVFLQYQHINIRSNENQMGRATRRNVYPSAPDAQLKSAVLPWIPSNLVSLSQIRFVISIGIKY